MSDGELTFFEAMALVGRNEANLAEVWIGALHKWTSLALQVDEDTPLSVFRHPSCKFRRAKPKRSRVQEMVRAYDKPTLNFDQVAAFAESVVHAVCEYVPTAINVSRKQECELTVVGVIEREFLEPR